jgi:hypothetical protein
MYNVVYNVVHSLSCFFDRVNSELLVQCGRISRSLSVPNSEKLNYEGKCLVQASGQAAKPLEFTPIVCYTPRRFGR